jgi:hypothetical protein
MKKYMKAAVFVLALSLATPFAAQAGIRAQGETVTGVVSTFPSPQRQVAVFSNGCSRTCSGDWTLNSTNHTWTCSGTAGPLVCPKTGATNSAE